MIDGAHMVMAFLFVKSQSGTKYHGWRYWKLKCLCVQPSTHVHMSTHVFLLSSCFAPSFMRSLNSTVRHPQ